MRPQVEIKFVPNAEVQLYWGDATLPEQANISNISSVLVNTYRGYKGFQLSQTSDSPVTPLDGTYKLYTSNGYKGFISRKLSDDNGIANVAISFYINGQVPEHLYVTFDAVNKEYAKHLRVYSSDNSTGYHYNNTSANVVVMLPLKEIVNGTMAQNVLITIVVILWSRKNSSVKITSISPFYSSIFAGDTLISFECSENSYDTSMSLRPGICEQYADVKVYDATNALHNLALHNVLDYDCQVTIRIQNDKSEEYTDIGTYVVNEWEIDANSSEVTILCHDKSYLFEKIDIQRTTVNTRTLNDFIHILFEQARGMSWKYADEDTRERCLGIEIVNSWYRESDLRTMLDKICAVGLLRIYWYLDTFIIARC